MRCAHRTRRNFLLALATALAAPRPLFGQAAKQLPRVALLFGGTAETSRPAADAFVQGLQSFGYADRRNVVLDVKYLEGRNDLVSEAIAQLIARRPSVVVVVGSEAAWAAKKATTTIPIVMAIVGDPVRQGLVASLARPGGNLTGNSILVETLALKRLELLRAVAPQASRIAAITNPENPAFPKVWPDLEAAAKDLRIDLKLFGFKDAGTLDSSLAAAAAWRPHAVLVGSDGLAATYGNKIIQMAAAIRVPAMYSHSQSALEGGLMSYSADNAALWRNAARFVDRILKGAKPADLPVEQPTHFDLIVNLKTAKALGIKIPPLVLAAANKVLE
jgi:putative ABC transport system substrate-binding protein